MVPTAQSLPPRVRSARIASAAASGNLVLLRVHRMARRILGLDRLEGAGPDLQLDARDLHSARPEGVKQRRREVESRRRCGDARLTFGVDGLVAKLIRRRRGAIDVRRQRQPAESVDGLAGGEAHKAHSAIALVQDGDRLDRGALPDGDPLAGPQRAPRPPDGDPVFPRRGMDEQHLGRCAALSRAEEAGMADPGGIDDQEVAGGNQVDEVGEDAVKQFRVRPGARTWKSDG